MTPSVQAKFLRLLQEREFQRLGGTQTLRADVRVIAATNRDPRMAMERGILREDLYYRLSAFEITLPPLRERPDDILVLAEAFLDEIGRTVGRARRGALEGRARSAPGSRLAGQYQRAAQRDRARRHPVRGRADHGRAPADHPDRAEAHSPAGAVRAGGRGGACRDESLDPDRGRQPRRGRARSHPEGDGPGPEQQVGRGEASRPAPGPALLTPQAPRPRSREGLAGARFCSTCPLLVTLRPWGRAHESRPKTSI
jgi:hypothetical protein